MDILVIDIIQLIFDQLDFPGQVNFRLISKFYARYFPITNLLDNVPNRKKKLTDEILKSYPSIIKLSVTNNTKITNINHCTNLRILHACNICGIGDNGLQTKGIDKLINLTELYADYNSKITNVNHCTNLRILYARGDCGIGDNGISKLTNLTKLNVNNNSEITNVNHCTNLRILYACNNCGISDKGMDKLTNLTKLDADFNSKITNVNHCINFRSLHA